MKKNQSQRERENWEKFGPPPPSVTSIELDLDSELNAIHFYLTIWTKTHSTIANDL